MTLRPGPFLKKILDSFENLPQILMDISYDWEPDVVVFPDSFEALTHVWMDISHKKL